MTYAVRDLVDHFAVNEHTVLEWIRSGELKAINVGRSLSKRKPRWRITQAALDSFELRRSSSPPPERVRTKRSTENQIVFYK